MVCHRADADGKREERLAHGCVHRLEKAARTACRQLPEIGRSIGKVLREFRKAQAAFSETLDEVSAEPKKVENEKVNLEQPAEEKKSAVSVDDVINMAKENPIVKENPNEKISGGSDSVVDNSNVGKRVDNSRGDSSGTSK